MTNPIPLAELRDVGRLQAIDSVADWTACVDLLDTVRQAILDTEPMRWCRVHKLPMRKDDWTNTCREGARLYHIAQPRLVTCDITTIVPVEVKTDD